MWTAVEQSVVSVYGTKYGTNECLPLVRIGTPPPLQNASLSHTPEPNGGYTLACGWGGGPQFGRLEKRPSTLSTLWFTAWWGAGGYSQYSQPSWVFFCQSLLEFKAQRERELYNRAFFQDRNEAWMLSSGFADPWVFGVDPDPDLDPQINASN